MNKTTLTSLPQPLSNNLTLFPSLSLPFSATLAHTHTGAIWTRIVFTEPSIPPYIHHPLYARPKSAITNGPRNVHLMCGIHIKLRRRLNRKRLSLAHVPLVYTMLCAHLCVCVYMYTGLYTQQYSIDGKPLGHPKVESTHTKTHHQQTHAHIYAPPQCSPFHPAIGRAEMSTTLPPPQSRCTRKWSASRMRRERAHVSTLCTSQSVVCSYKTKGCAHIK